MSENHPMVGDSQQIRDNTLWRHADTAGEGRVFITERGALGIEYNGRIAVKDIAKWVGLAWGDLDTPSGRR